MNDLTQIKCDACRIGAPLATDEEIEEYMKQIPAWQILTDKDGTRKIERVFKFKNFVEALDFTNEVGKLAEENGHHPAVLTEWGKVTVTYWTHKIQGLHLNDFVMAKKTDGLLKGEN